MYETFGLPVGGPRNPSRGTQDLFSSSLPSIDSRLVIVHNDQFGAVVRAPDVGFEFALFCEPEFTRMTHSVKLSTEDISERQRAKCLMFVLARCWTF